MPDDIKNNDQPSPPPEKPAAAAHPPAAKPAGPAPQPWDSELVDRVRARFGSGVREASSYLGQNYFIVDSSVVFHVLSLLHDEEEFDYLVDVTAVHYPQRERPFDVVWILYSFNRNQRIRVKTELADGQPAPS